MLQFDESGYILIREMCSIVPIAALFVLAANGNGRSADHQDGAISISVIAGRPVVDGVFLNGKGPWRFLLDTGAQTNQVRASLAAKLGLEPVFRAERATISGSEVVAGGRVAEVALGATVVHDQEFLFTGLEDVRTLASNIAGVLGQEFLSHFDYLMDFSGRRLVLSGAEPDGGRRTAMHLFHGRPAIETDRGRLVIDSGTEMAILFGGAAAAIGRVWTAFRSAPGAGTQHLKYRIEGRVYGAPTAALPRVSAEEDGLLPASLFRGLYVSNSGRYMILEPVTR